MKQAIFLAGISIGANVLGFIPFLAAFYFSENERLYEKYLFRFLEEPTFPELFKAIEEDRREDARRAAHSLKGITATLGFTSLNTPVKAQEFEFKNGRWEEGNQYTDELKKEYARIISVLRAVKALEN